MAILNHFFQPETLEEALDLLARRDLRLTPLAGGTQLIGALETGALPTLDGVVDLRMLKLDTIRTEGASVHIGATATLSAVAAHPVAGTLADGLLTRAAQGEGALNLRNMATLGGVIATAAADSEVYAALLALDARVTVASAGGSRHLSLASLDQITGLITEVSLPASPSTGALARVARTPADRPIVAALAVCRDGTTRVALCGVAHKPVLHGATLNPPDDFKGSAAYRRAMADLLVARVLVEVGG